MKNKMTDEQILEAAKAIRAKADRKRDAAVRRENLKLVGKCFKYQNCYSCPEKDEDYWWLYRRVEGVDESGWMLCLEFETDVRGKIEIRRVSHCSFHGEEIPKREFHVAMRKTVATVRSLLK